jgi:hypothetical protein
VILGLPNGGDRPARWVAGLVLTAYAAVLAAAAVATTTRRDVT